MSDTTFPPTPSLSDAAEAELAPWGPLDEASRTGDDHRRPHLVEPR